MKRKKREKLGALCELGVCMQKKNQTARDESKQEMGNQPRSPSSDSRPIDRTHQNQNKRRNEYLIDS